MSNSRAAIRYAKAILDLAVTHKATSALETDMQFIIATISNSNQLREMLVSPVVNADAKEKALLGIFKGSHTITEAAISKLIANKRIGILNEVALKYITLNDKLKGEDVAYVTTAVPLVADMEKRVLAQITKLTGNKVSIKNKVDEAIIGGFVLRLGDMQYDASISNKLNTIKREFTNSL